MGGGTGEGGEQFGGELSFQGLEDWLWGTLWVRFAPQSLGFAPYHFLLPWDCDRGKHDLRSVTASLFFCSVIEQGSPTWGK